MTGGLCVGLLNTIRTALEESLASDKAQSKRGFQYGLKSVLIPIFKAVSAAITLGTGNSLGPEGPSVEIGASVATGVSRVLRNSKERRLAMVAAGSAAGISSGTLGVNFTDSVGLEEVKLDIDVFKFALICRSGAFHCV